MQWMTAGSGIIHQEMPTGNAAGQMHGFQLWANLPRDQKMCTPRYQDVKSADISSLTDDDGTHIRVIAGDYRGYCGPVDGIDTDPIYLDIAMPANSTRRFPFDAARIAYLREATGTPRPARGDRSTTPPARSWRSMTSLETARRRWKACDEVEVTSAIPARFFVVHAREPVFGTTSS